MRGNAGFEGGQGGAAGLGRVQRHEKTGKSWRGVRGIHGIQVQGVEGGSGGSRAVQRFGEKTVKNTKEPEKRSGAVWLGYYAATSRILCRSIGSGYPLSVLAVAHPAPRDFKLLGGGKGPPKCPTRHPSVGG